MDKESENNPDHFFSFKKYFKSQAKELALNHIKVKKTISRSGLTEEKTMDPLDWENELKLFSDADLNKKAWITLYEVDTLKNDSMMTISYITKDNTLQVKQAVVVFKHEVVDEIRISGSFKNFYYQSDLFLVYKAGVKYEIKGAQSIRFARKQDFEIEGEFF